jgi:hypothetical protein
MVGYILSWSQGKTTDDTRDVLGLAGMHSNEAREGNWLSKRILSLCSRYCTYYIDKYIFEKSYGYKGLEGHAL